MEEKRSDYIIWKGTVNRWTSSVSLIGLYWSSWGGGKRKKTDWMKSFISHLGPLYLSGDIFVNPWSFIRCITWWIFTVLVCFCWCPVWGCRLFPLMMDVFMDVWCLCCLVCGDVFVMFSWLLIRDPDDASQSHFLGLGLIKQMVG